MFQARAASGLDARATIGGNFDSLPTHSPLERLMASISPLDRLAPPPAYTVRAGDTLSAIADRFGTSVDVLVRINGLPDPDRIGAGQALRLPASENRSTHVVRPGETLSEIAAAHGTEWQDLARINHIANPDRIQPGQTLQLRASSAPARADPEPAAAPASPAQRAEPARPAAADTAHRLGTLSERYETSGRGPGTVSSGVNDPGGVSYGTYQLSSTKGTLRSFLNNEGSRWSGELTGTPGGGQFTGQWKAIAAREPQTFRDAQHAFIERTHYAPAVNAVAESTGLDLSTRHEAVRDATWSTSVQHGRAAQVLEAAVARTDAALPRGSAQYDRALVENIYAERTSYVRGLAEGNGYSEGEARQLRELTQVRYPAELRDALAMIDRPAQSPAAAPAQGPQPVAPLAGGSASGAARFADIVNASGDATAKANLAAGRKVLVAVRTDSTTAANGTRGEYNDTMALVWKDAAGQHHAQVFDGNTEPAGVYAARGYGVDVNGDGRKELGRLVEGAYRYELQPGKFAGNRFFRATQTQPALRDSNHDGRFSSADQVDRAGAGRSLLIHQGGNGSTGSAGCQTLKPADFNALLKGLGEQTSVSYVLVNANR